MKVQIRNNIFETNSSSVHSITFCTESEFNKWKDGKLIYSCDQHKLIPSNDIDIEESEIGWDYETYESFFDDSYYDTYIETYTTPGGEEIVAFGVYGSDR